MTAKLCVSGMLNIQEIFQVIQPSRAKIIEDAQAFFKSIAARVKKAETISTLAAIQADELSSSRSNGTGGLNSALVDSYASASISTSSTTYGVVPRSFASIIATQEAEDIKQRGEVYNEVGFFHSYLWP